MLKKYFTLPETISELFYSVFPIFTLSLFNDTFHKANPIEFHYMKNRKKYIENSIPGVLWGHLSEWTEE
jgi:hypothetical protein